MKKISNPGCFFILFIGMIIMVFLIDLNFNRQRKAFSGNELVIADLIAGAVLIIIAAILLSRNKRK